MSTNINHVTLSGNLTRDAEVRTTASGTEVLSFTIASNSSRKNAKTGEWEEHPNFVNCYKFGQGSEALAKYLAKGTKVAIEGELSYHAWEQDDGQKRSALEIKVHNLDFMSRRGDGSGSTTPQQQEGESYESLYTADDIPF